MTTSEEAAWVSAIVVSLALIGMWTVLYLGMRSARDGRCPARARRELHEELRLRSESQLPAPVPAGRNATVGQQRRAREREQAGRNS